LVVPWVDWLAPLGPGNLKNGSTQALTFIRTTQKKDQTFDQPKKKINRKYLPEGQPQKRSIQGLTFIKVKVNPKKDIVLSIPAFRIMHSGPNFKIRPFNSKFLILGIFFQIQFRDSVKSHEESESEEKI
jgi:hypothetical protein